MGDTTGPAGLKQLRAESGLTQEQLAGLAGLHVRTIRGLETGHIARPRRQSLDLIARALGLDVTGQLGLLAAWNLPVTDAVIPAAMPAAADEPNIIDQVIGGSFSTCLPVSLSERVIVGANRKVVSRRTEEVVVAVRDGVHTRHVVYEPGDPNTDLDRLRLVDLENCQVIRAFVDPVRGMKVFELGLGRSLAENQSHVLRYTVDNAGATVDDDAPAPREGQEIGGFFRPPSSYVLEIRFHPAATPRHCEQVFQARPLSRPRRVATLPPSSTHTVHIALVNPKPGGHGIVWSW